MHALFLKRDLGGGRATFRNATHARWLGRGEETTNGADGGSIASVFLLLSRGVRQWPVVDGDRLSERANRVPSAFHEK